MNHSKMTIVEVAALSDRGSRQRMLAEVAGRIPVFAGNCFRVAVAAVETRFVGHFEGVVDLGTFRVYLSIKRLIFEATAKVSDWPNASNRGIL